MPHSQQRYLFDMLSAAERIMHYTENQTFADYSVSPQMRDSVERCFELIGEALRQGIFHTPSMAAIFPESAAIIGLRNNLAHEYGKTDDKQVWSVVENKLPDLISRVKTELSRYEKAE